MRAMFLKLIEKPPFPLKEEKRKSPGLYINKKLQEKEKKKHDMNYE